MKKILFITNIPNPYRQKFYNILAQTVDLTVIYEASCARNIDFAHMEKSKYRAIYLREGEIQEKRVNSKVFKYIRNYKEYDEVVVTNYAYMTELCAILFLMIHGCKFIFELDGPIKYNRKMKLLKKKMLGYAKAIFCPGKEAKEVLIKYGIREEKIIDYNFTSVQDKDLINECLSGEKKNEIKEEMGIKETVALLYVGRIIYKKGIDILVEEFVKKYGNSLEVGLYLVGNYYDFAYYDSLHINSYNNIHYIKFCEKDLLQKYYYCTDIFVFPTRDDPWGLVINEAVAAGLPIVSSDKCGAAKELISDYRNGFIVKNRNDFIMRIQELINNKELREEMSKNNILLSYDWTIEKMVQRHLTYWKQ